MSSQFSKYEAELKEKLRKEIGKEEQLIWQWLSKLKYPLLLGLLKNKQIPPSILIKYARLAHLKSSTTTMRQEAQKQLKYSSDRSEYDSIKENIESLNFQLEAIDNSLDAKEAEITPFITKPFSEMVEEYQPSHQTEIFGGFAATKAMMKAIEGEGGKMPPKGRSKLPAKKLGQAIQSDETSKEPPEEIDGTSGKQFRYDG